METKEMVPKLRFPRFDLNFDSKKLGQLSIIKGRIGFRGYTKSDLVKEGEGPLVIGGKNIVNNKLDFSEPTYLSWDKYHESPEIKVKKGQIIYSQRGTLGECAIISHDFEGTINPSMVLIKDIKILPQFLYYFLTTQSHYKMAMRLSSSTAVPMLSQKQIGSFIINYPEIKEQQKIASFFSSVDDKISQLEKMKTLLETYKRGIMQKIFSQELRFKDDDGEEFPEWEIKKLGEQCEIIGGGTPESTNENYWGGEINWFTPSELKTKYIHSSKRKITQEGLNNSSAKTLPKGSLLLTTRATIGEVSFCSEKCCTNQGFQSFLPTSKLDLDFLYYWIQHNKNELVRKASGSTFLEISKKEIQKIMIHLPVKDEQQKIASFLSSIDKKIEITSAQLEKTREFKKGLLQQMFV